MHGRKAAMSDRADGFIALPGGYGTLDEVLEILTWNQLGTIAKPVAFFDVGGYWTLLLAWLDMAVAEGFVAPAHRRLVTPGWSLQELLDTFDAWEPPPGRWEAGP